jgi:hypothetical protein
MTSHPFASIGTEKPQLCDRVINTNQRAQRIITVAAEFPSTNTHAAMAAYEKACEHLRSDILHASKLFPDTDALLSWLLDDFADDALGKQDRISLALTIRTMNEEAEQR